MRDETQETVNSLHHCGQKWFGRRSVQLPPLSFYAAIHWFGPSTYDWRQLVYTCHETGGGPFKSDDTYFL